MVAYTTNKGYPQPTVGGDANQWGTLLNQGWGIADLNLGGVLSLSVAGSSNVTITSTQAENLVHRLTGVLTGNISYILPAVGGFYIIDNKTTGSFTITVKTSAGGSTGIVARQGYAQPLYADGTNVFGIAPALAPNATDVAIGGSSAKIVGSATTGGVAITGTNTNDAAAAGYIGEIEQTTFASPVSLTSNTAANIGAQALTAGNWDVWGNVSFTPSAGARLMEAWVSTTSATNPGPPNVGGYTSISFATDIIGAPTVLFAGYRFLTLAAPANVYLSGLAFFGSGTCTATGYIGARRRY